MLCVWHLTGDTGWTGWRCLKREGGVWKGMRIWKIFYRSASPTSSWGDFRNTACPSQIIRSAKVRFLWSWRLRVNTFLILSFSLSISRGFVCIWISYVKEAGLWGNRSWTLVSLTAGDGVVVLGELTEEQHFLLSQLQSLLLDQVHLLLGFEGLLGHHKVLLEHALLLLPPLSPGVFDLGGLWQKGQTRRADINSRKRVTIFILQVIVHTRSAFSHNAVTAQNPA